eukprot:11451352-Heterocapsa_arctica.AAC.1
MLIARSLCKHDFPESGAPQRTQRVGEPIVKIRAARAANANADKRESVTRLPRSPRRLTVFTFGFSSFVGLTSCLCKPSFSSSILVLGGGRSWAAGAGRLRRRGLVEERVVSGVRSGGVVGGRSSSG